MPSEPRIFDPEGGFPDPTTLRDWQGAGVIVDALQVVRDGNQVHVYMYSTA